MLPYLGNPYRGTIRQKTIIRGKGVHSGDTSTLTIEPAPIGTGLVFRPTRADKGSIPVSPFYVTGTANAVTLANEHWEVQTVEHLLAACAVLGLTDAYFGISAAEIPIMDGSAAPFYEAIQSAGIELSSTPVAPLVLRSPVWVVDRDRYVVALPSPVFQTTYSIHYEHPLLSGQSVHMELNNTAFTEEIVRARTFGFRKDVEALRGQGLARGASLENAVVLDDSGYENELRYANECVRHKVLDLVGDLYLMNRPLVAHVIAHKAGHALDVSLAKKILTGAAMDELAQRKEQESLRHSA
ncbi:MAG: UDP-3-O-[3-hydroxymyristoyl] N-acetylglucosamine deacetylase [Spirochaetales bacterium]|nr:UDP-3-O-[3-hydroxymyristoyl] N-acetylglucosamine deacetylase [Spirochaetales bacterium]